MVELNRKSGGRLTRPQFLFTVTTSCDGEIGMTIVAPDRWADMFFVQCIRDHNE